MEFLYIQVQRRKKASQHCLTQRAAHETSSDINQSTMRFSELANAETAILSGSSFQLTPFDVPFSQGQEHLRGFTCRRKDGHTNYYYNEKFDKERIVLHFTAGHLKADLLTLMKKDYHVSTPFLIARNGTLLQLFSSALWSYHLGPGAQGGNKRQSQRTIGIEITNYGILEKKGDLLHTIYSQPGRSDIYCHKDDQGVYTQLRAPFRQAHYFDKFTDDQYDSVIVLLRYLTDVYGIPREFLPEDKRYHALPEIASFKGIVSHVNYRPAGKWDIGPAFDWERVIQGVQSSTYTPLRSGLELPSDLESMPSLEGMSGVLQDESEADKLYGFNKATSEGDEKVYGPDGPGE